MSSDLLTTSQVARALGLTKQSVQRAASQGRLPCTRDAIGQRWFHEADVAAYAERYHLRLAPCHTSGPRQPTMVAPEPDPSLEGPHADGLPDATVGGPQSPGATSLAARGATPGVAPIEGSPGPIAESPAIGPTTATNSTTSMVTTIDGATLGKMINSLRGMVDTKQGFIGPVASYWKQPFDTLLVANLGERVRRLQGTCLSCSAHGVRPLWADIALHQFGRQRQDLPRLYDLPAARVAQRCQQCLGAQGSHPARGTLCPVCVGAGVIPDWLYTTFLKGLAGSDATEPRSWSPIPCIGCAGWGWMSTSWAACVSPSEAGEEAPEESPESVCPPSDAP